MYVCRYFLKAALNCALLCFRIVTLGGKLLIIFMLALTVLFFDNKIGWHKNIRLGNMVIQLGFEQCTS